MKRIALIVVDIQNDYFPGGAFEQEGADAAAEKAAELIGAFRSKNLPVVHIQHVNNAPEAGFFLPDTEGVAIHSSVAPAKGEPVIIKQFPNSFRETTLGETLQGQGIEHVVIIGMMTLMCIDATTRAANDLGYTVTVAHDACAARALEFNGVSVPAAHVHAAFLAALSMFYAQVEETAAIIEAL